jgi:competence protein ComFC
MRKKLGNLLMDIFFPKFCLGCRKEGSYLCEDCRAVLEVSGFHQKTGCPGLYDLYFPLEYKNPLLKVLIRKFKYEPFVKELAEPLSELITGHFQLMDVRPDFSGFALLPVPLAERRKKWRGFNQAEEIARRLACFFNLPLSGDVLFRTRETPPQTKIESEERETNMTGAFACADSEKVSGKNFLLVDDVYTTGSTMKEAAAALKRKGAKRVIGIVVARAVPGQDAQ